MSREVKATAYPTTNTKPSGKPLPGKSPIISLTLFRQCIFAMSTFSMRVWNESKREPVKCSTFLFRYVLTNIWQPTSQHQNSPFRIPLPDPLLHVTICILYVLVYQTITYTLDLRNESRWLFLTIFEKQRASRENPLPRNSLVISLTLSCIYEW